MSFLQRNYRIFLSIVFMLWVCSFSHGKAENIEEKPKDAFITMDEMILEEDYLQSIEDGIFPIVECNTTEDCLSVLPGLGVAYNTSSKVAHPPVCLKIFNSTHGEEENLCSCGGLCLSRSWHSYTQKYMYYCGECGRVGSECVNQSCGNPVSACDGAYCDCKGGGTFQDLYYCIVPYYGYEIALQMGLVACIFIAFCLLIASIYNYVWSRRFGRNAPTFPRFWRRNSGVREAPAHDTPPKYDDVVDKLPSYEDALDMMKEAEIGLPDSNGIANPSFERDSLNLPPPYSVKDSRSSPSIEEDQIPTTAAIKQEDVENVTIEPLSEIKTPSNNTEHTGAIEDSGRSNSSLSAEHEETQEIRDPTLSGAIPKRRRNKRNPPPPPIPVDNDRNETQTIDICPQNASEELQIICKPLSENNISRL